MPTPQLRCSPGHTWGRDPVESCSFCWNRSLSTWFCRSSSKTRFFSLMHSSRRSWSGRGGSARTPRAPRHPPSPPTLSRPPATHLLVEKCLHHVVGNLGSRGEVWGGAHGHARPRALAHACAHVYHVCTTCVPRVWLCSPVPRPGSVRMSPAGSHWPGPGLSSLPRTEQGQLRGHRGHPPWHRADPLSPGGAQGHSWQDRAAPGAVAHEGHGKLESATHRHGVQTAGSTALATAGSWHWLHGGHGHGFTVAMAMDSKWPWLPGGTSHGCPVVPCPGGPVPTYLQLPQALQQLMAGARLSQHCRAPGSRCLSHTFRHRCCGGHTSRRGPCRPLAGGTWPEAPSGPAQPGSPLPGFGCPQPRPCAVSPAGENWAEEGEGASKDPQGRVLTPPAPRAAGAHPAAHLLPGGTGEPDWHRDAQHTRDQDEPRGTRMCSTTGTGTGISPGAPVCPQDRDRHRHRVTRMRRTAGTGIGTGAPGCAAPPGYWDMEHSRR